MFMNKTGPSRKVSDDEIVEAIMQIKDPVVSTKEISEAIGLGSVGTRQRLYSLEEAGVVESKKIANGNAWWLSS